MTYPSSGPGYPQQGGSGPFPQAPQPPHAPQAPSAGGLSLSPTMVLAGLVTLLGLVQYFVGFSDEADNAGTVTLYLLAGGLLAALRLLPNAPKVLPFAALFSVLGAFESIDLVIGYSEGSSVPGIITVVLILGVVQLLAAVAALLFDTNVLKVPAPKPQAPAGYGPPPQQQYGQPGPYGQPQFGQAQPPSSAEASGAYPQTGPTASHQPTQYGPPVTTPPGQPPTQQPTTYAPQQGQFFGQSTDSTQQPSTPPEGTPTSN